MPAPVADERDCRVRWWPQQSESVTCVLWSTWRAISAATNCSGAETDAPVERAGLARRSLGRSGEVAGWPLW
ncbi:hypothetical protein [Nocardia sp. alder85J]|uniref:hypothetical protein n=1 Tax=Nocardia sp. alder85J TaxID=2862949 RepID=UPI001CD34185|nr:hypothetical protein [Nocardia sp. alder85J]MCX4091199.1 hypothetical protein [Nocardia sp. alder85J]